jgi:transposase-like protein
LEEELAAVLRRNRYGRSGQVAGYRHGHRDRQVLGAFGKVTISVPRARLAAAEGKAKEWRSKVLPTYKRRTVQADQLLAGSYLASTNTRRVRRAFAALFGGAISKDTVRVCGAKFNPTGKRGRSAILPRSTGAQLE